MVVSPFVVRRGGCCFVWPAPWTSCLQMKMHIWMCHRSLRQPPMAVAAATLLHAHPQHGGTCLWTAHPAQCWVAAALSGPQVQAAVPATWMTAHSPCYTPS